jgi:hypothetical protein
MKEIGATALGFGLTLGAGALAFYFLRQKTPIAPSSPAAIPPAPIHDAGSALAGGLGVVQGDTPTQGPAPLAPPPGASVAKAASLVTPAPPQNPTSPADAIGGAAFNTFGKQATLVAGGTLNIAANATETGVLDPIATAPREAIQGGAQGQGVLESAAELARDPSRAGVAGLLGSVANVVGSVPAQVASFAKDAFDLRGNTKEGRRAIFKREAGASVSAGFSAIPGVGLALAGIAAALGQTHEGQRALTEVSRYQERFYQGQKSIFSGHVSEGLARLTFQGGSTHKERVKAALQKDESFKLAHGFVRTPTGGLVYQSPNTALLAPLTKGWTDVKDSTAAGGIRRVFTPDSSAGRFVDQGAWEKEQAARMSAAEIPAEPVRSPATVPIVGPNAQGYLASFAPPPPQPLTGDLSSFFSSPTASSS